MRTLIMVFLILSPLIAIIQNYHLHPQLPAFALAHAQAMVASAYIRMGSMVHAVQELLG